MRPGYKFHAKEVDFRPPDIRQVYNNQYLGTLKTGLAVLQFTLVTTPQVTTVMVGSSCPVWSDDVQVGGAHLNTANLSTCTIDAADSRMLSLNSFAPDTSAYGKLLTSGRSALKDPR